jgi:outer membrane immunogenic protein
LTGTVPNLVAKFDFDSGRIRIEWDYLMMGNVNNSFSLPAPLAAASNSISQNINMVTLRLNYKFGGPVVARY